MNCLCFQKEVSEMAFQQVNSICIGICAETAVQGVRLAVRFKITVSSILMTKM